MSTKKLPSRKMRGRIFSSASSCRGSPSSFSRISTTAAWLPRSRRSIAVTLPTSIPATRTGEFSRRLLAVLNTARTV